MARRTTRWYPLTPAVAEIEDEAPLPLLDAVAAVRIAALQAEVRRLRAENRRLAERLARAERQRTFLLLAAAQTQR